MERGRKSRGWGLILRRGGIGALGALLALGTMAAPAWAAAPDAPAVAPTVFPGDAQLSVNFSAPASDGGVAIDNYTASCTSIDGGAPGTNSNAGIVQTITVTGLTNGKTYTCSVTAGNTDGTSAPSPASAAVVPAAVPDAPAVQSVASGNGQILVTYTAPANDGGSTITAYTAACTSSNGGAFGFTGNGGTVTPLAVSGLTNGSTYSCTVTATNGVGTSAPSAPLGPVVPSTIPGTPGAPSVAPGNGQIQASFGAPATDGGRAITSYTVGCTSSDGGVAGSNFGAGSPITVSSLTNGKTYTCTVSAANGNGPGAASAPSAAVVPAAVPAAPAQPSTASGNGQIVVTFSGAAGNGSTITAYTAACSSSDGGAFGSAGNGGTITPLTVSGLTNGKTYTCTVTATNGVGTGPASPASAAVIPAAAPSAPALPAIASGNTQIVVTFAAPADNGSAITSYNAACTSSDGGAAGSNAGAGSPITVGGLTNGKTYTCTVTATNGVGPGAPSAASAAAVPATGPDAPAQPTVASGNGQLVVTFAAPASNGGSAITAYTAACTSTDGGVAGSLGNLGAVAPITVPGLTNGKTYTCTVTATNSAATSLLSPASVAVIPAGAPSAPLAPAVARGASGSITAAFAAPAANGSAITGYTVSCASSDGGTAGSNTGATSPITVAALTNGKTYTCTFTATNGAGTSPASPASAVIVVGIPETPLAPTVAPGNGQIIVIFTPPADNGNAITGYNTSCTSSNGGAAGSSSGATSPITVTGVTNGKTYTCTLTATNSAGTSGTSPASANVVPNLVPVAPAAPTAAPSNAQIAVTFTAPFDNGNPITSYKVTCTSSDGGNAGTQVGPASPITVAALTNAKSYTCTVSATNVIGTGAPSPGSAVVVPFTVPMPPTVTSAASGDGSLTVSFTPNSNNGAAITAYAATCTSSNGGVTGTASGTASPITVTGLTNGNLYACTAKATNLAGTSAASPASKPVIVGQPGPPTILSVESGAATAATGALKVSFHAGNANGGPITLFRVACFSDSAAATVVAQGTGSPIVVPGLKTAHDYGCTVAETNFLGTSAESEPLYGTVGTPSAPKVVRVMRLPHGLALAFLPAVNNGNGIYNYRARCNSSDGGVPSAPLQLTSPIVVNNLSAGKTYTCMVSALNDRGESTPAKVGPVVTGTVQATDTTSCTGRSGSLRVSPGLELAVNKAHTLKLAATLGQCSSPYVRSAKLALTFRSKTAFSCKSAIGKPNAGAGTVTWTAPAALGGSDAAIQLVIGSTHGHVTTARFHGTVTSRANVFTDQHVSGTITLRGGLGEDVAGGDCSSAKRLQKLTVTSVSMTIS